VVDNAGVSNDGTHAAFASIAHLQMAKKNGGT
jgi:hypothetical protein